MKASELITMLVTRIAEDGDLDVVVQALDCGIYNPPREVEVLPLFDRFEGKQWDLSPGRDQKVTEHEHLFVIAPREP